MNGEDRTDQPLKPFQVERRETGRAPDRRWDPGDRGGGAFLRVSVLPGTDPGSGSLRLGAPRGGPELEIASALGPSGSRSKVIE